MIIICKNCGYHMEEGEGFSVPLCPSCGTQRWEPASDAMVLVILRFERTIGGIGKWFRSGRDDSAEKIEKILSYYDNGDE